MKTSKTPESYIEMLFKMYPISKTFKLFLHMQFKLFKMKESDEMYAVYSKRVSLMKEYLIKKMGRHNFFTKYYDEISYDHFLMQLGK